MRKKTFFFSFRSLLSASLSTSSNFFLTHYIFLSLLLALTHAVLQDYTLLSLAHWDSSSFSLAEWPLLLFLHLFLHFFLPHSSHQVAINASQLVLTFVHKDDFNSSHWKTSPASSICFADFLAILQQAKCGLDPRGAMHTQQS